METENLRCLSVDGVVVLGDTVVVMRRSHPPHEGDWVLPGGMVERDETASEACEREVEEEIDLEVEAEEFVGLYDDPDRDERGNVSAAYICRRLEADEAAEPRPREEATEVKTVEVDETSSLTLGFDHAEILSDASEILSEPETDPR
ncbi:MAG: NUDIX domain-containing protein [Halobacteria archaeon]|nr:NUDIX domain-containing protein [Halobacteria archaeon]